MGLQKQEFQQIELFNSHQQGDFFYKPIRYDESLDEEQEERLCIHDKVKEECDPCKKVFESQTLAATRKQKIKEETVQIGITLSYTQEPQTQAKNSIMSISHIGREKKGTNEPTKLEEQNLDKKVRGKIKRTIGFEYRRAMDLNELLKKYFGASFKIDLDGYPTQSTIKLDGVVCKIMSGEGGFYIRVPFSNKNKKPTTLRKTK